MDDSSARNQTATSSKDLPIWRRGATLVSAGLGAGLAAALSLGYATYSLSRPPDVPEVSPGDIVESGRWRVTVLDARFAPANPDAAFHLERRDTVQVAMQLTNLSQETSNSYYRLVKLDPLPAGLDEAVFLLRRDRSHAGSLHPDMQEFVTAYYALAPGAAPPASLDLVVTGEFYKPRDNLYGAPGWFPADPAARLTLPVKEPAR
jgi:hypothetical protein